MHQSLKFIFRLILALIIFTVTLALLLTCYSKFNTLAQANTWLEHRQQIELVSSNQQSYLLLSNSQKPDRAIFIVLKGKGYISKISCEHYQATLCLSGYDKSPYREVQKAVLQIIGPYQYIQSINYVDTQTNMPSNLTLTQQQVINFYQQDMSALKYYLLGVFLFTIIALISSIRILKNFRSFLTK